MANLTMNGRQATTSSFVSMKTTLNHAEFNGASHVWENVVLSVPEGQLAVDVSVRETPSAPSAHYETIQPGESRFFARVNFDCVFLKSADTSAIEFSGTPE